MSGNSSRIVMPREHGSWFMLLVPFFIGAALTHFSWYQVLLLLSVLCAFLAMTPAILWVKSKTQKDFYHRWFYQYLGLSALFGIGLLAHYPLLLRIASLILPFFAIQVFFLKIKAERHLLNDLSGIIALNFTLLASYYVGKGVMDDKPFLYLAYLVPFFFGSALHIKSLIRERNNPKMRQMSLLYNWALLLAYILLHSPFWLVVGSLLVFVRLLLFTQQSSYKILTIGIVEIVSSITFGAFFVAGFWGTR